MSKLIRLFEDQEHMDRILASVGVVSSDPSTTSEGENDGEDEDFYASFSIKMDIEKGLVDSFHALQDFFSEQGLEIGTLCKYPAFQDWISNYVDIPNDEIIYSSTSVQSTDDDNEP